MDDLVTETATLAALELLSLDLLADFYADLEIDSAVGQSLRRAARGGLKNGSSSGRPPGKYELAGLSANERRVLSELAELLKGPAHTLEDDKWSDFLWKLAYGESTLHSSAIDRAVALVRLIVPQDEWESRLEQVEGTSTLSEWDRLRLATFADDPFTLMDRLWSLLRLRACRIIRARLMRDFSTAEWNELAALQVVSAQKLR
jgi:hypothetical protein